MGFMGTDIHALIRGFLQQQTVIPLAGESSLPPDAYTKAGIVPFIRENEILYCVAKPRGTMPDLGAPPFQLCKGTRQHRLKDIGWRDMKEAAREGMDKETLAETALREGVEELGLTLENMGQIFDMGGFAFSSATTGKEKHMWLFAAEMKDRDDFLHDREIAQTTEARQWLSAGEFAVAGRADHRYIVDAIETRLKEHFRRE